MTGWPWPLGGVQSFFENLWNQLSTAATAAVSIVSTWINDAISGLWTSINTAFTGLWTSISEGLGGLWTSISGAVGGLWDSVSGALGNLWTGFVDALGNAVSGISTMFDGALAAIGGWVGDALAGVAKALGEALSGFIGWIQTQFNTLVGWLVGGIQWLGTQLRSVFEALGTMILAPVTAALKPGSPPEPLGAVTKDFGNALMTNIVEQCKAIHKSPAQRELAVAAGGAVLGGIGLMHAVGGALTMAFDATHPVKDWGTQELFHRIVLNLMSSPVTSAILATPVIIGIITPMRQYFNAMFTPEVPGAGDLIRFVVREVITVGVFYENMKYHGFSEFWGKAYWEAHWVLPSRGELVDAFHRKVITDAELSKFVVWHDYSPTARPGIAKSDVDILSGIRKTLIPRVDLRYGWELGRLSDAELLERYEWLGYEDDAPLMADIQKFRVLTAEYAALRRTYMGLYIDGKITLDFFRTKLVEFKTAPAAIPLWLERAEKERERRLKAPPEIEPKAITRAEATWAYEHGLKPESWLRSTLKALDLSDDRIELTIEIANKRVEERAKPPPVVTYRSLTTTQIRDLYRFRYLSEAELPAAFESIGYSPADAANLTKIMVEIEAARVAAEYDSEKRKLRDNAVKDYVKGYILEDVLRADLAELGYPADAIDYYVADAMADRDRKQKDKLLDLWEDGYVKDLVTDEKLTEYAAEILVDPDALKLFLDAAYIRKYRKPKGD